MKGFGDAIFREAYYATAACKYRAALACLARAATGSDPGDVATRKSAKALEFGCRLNVATCLLRRNAELGAAVQLCTEALEIAKDSSGQPATRAPAKCSLRCC